MRNRDLFRLLAFAGSIIMAVSLSGCSLAGYGAGVAIDNSRSDTRIVDVRECAGIETGTDVEIHMKASASYRGSFVGLDRGNGFEKKDLDDLPGRDSIQLKTFMTINVVDSTSGNMETRNGPESLLGDSGGIVPRDNLKRISVGDIDSIEVPRKKYGKWIGLGIGAAVDAAIIIAGIAISSMGPMFSVN